MMIFLAALIFALSFIGSDYFWPCSFFFLVPIFLNDFNCSLPSVWWQGFVWGCITYGIQCSVFFRFMYDYQVGMWGYGLVILALIVIAGCSGVWFIGIKVFQSYFRWIKLSGLVMVTACFFLIIHIVSLSWLAGTWYGYPFSYPLIPLWDVSKFVQWSVWQWGIIPGLILLIVLQVLVACKEYFLFSFVLSSLCMGEIVICFSNFNGLVKDKCAIVRPSTHHVTVYGRVQELAVALSEASRINNDVRLFIFPESVFPWADYESHCYLARILCNYCHPESFIILGACRMAGEVKHNSSLCLHKGRIIFYYDKKELVPFFEKVHYSCKSIISPLTGTTCVSGSKYQEGMILLVDDLCHIVICAEMFWGQIQKRASNIVALVNDKQFAYAYFPKLMHIWASMRAVEGHKALLYGSYIL